MPSFSMIDPGAMLELRARVGSRARAFSGHLRTVKSLPPVLLVFGSAFQVLPAWSEPAACQSFAGAAQQVCGLAASIPEASEAPGSGGASVRAVAPLSADAFRAVERDRIDADPESLLRQPIAVGPAQCFYFGVGDYRCVMAGATPVVVAAPIVIPPDSQASVEQGCQPKPAGITQPCTYRILFVPFSAIRVKPNQGGTVVFRSGNIMAMTKGGAASGNDKHP